MFDQKAYKHQYYLDHIELYKERDKKKYLEKSEEIKRRRRTRYTEMTPEEVAKYKAYRKEYVAKTRDVQAARKQTDKYKFGEYRLSASKRNYEFLLTQDEFNVIFHSSCTYCDKEDARGIDRVDSSVGYTKENSVGACKVCNIMKSTHTREEFINHAKRIAAFNS